MLYSDSLQAYLGEFKPSMSLAIEEIKQYFGVDSLKVLTFDKFHIVIPVVFEVSLPSMGAVNGLDIRHQEPMLIKLSIEDYPNFAPVLMSDRNDFPKEKLSHLYISEEGTPAKLCLVRNSLHEWFATVKLRDFLDAGANWLYKAGIDRLNDDGEEFDPIRIEENVRDNHYYRYEILNEVAAQNQRLISEVPVALFAGGQILKNGKISEYRTTVNVPFIAIAPVLEALKKKGKDVGSNDTNTIFSCLFWDPEDKTETNFLNSLPTNYGQLKDFFSIRGINLKDCLLRLEKLGVITRLGLPIIYALKRPKKIIGSKGNFDFLNFLVILPEKGVAHLKDNDRIYLHNHVEPFSVGLATYVSGKGLPPSVFYIGAGSLGSKMIMHDVRSGNLNIAICDNDKMLPHNLARHVLFPEHIGMNKANALIDLIKKFYAVDNSKSLIAYDTSVVYLNKQLVEFQNIVDTTASRQVLNHLITLKFPNTLRYYKAEIADEGALGLLYKEGKDRNPRMDDLTNLACFYATLKKPLQIWRMNDARRTVTTLDVGLGCSSTTSIMADDTLSFHAAAFSRILSKLTTLDKPSDAGLLVLTSLDGRTNNLNISTEQIDVLPFDELECQLSSGWQVRMMGGIREKLLEACALHGQKETGGVLIGIANYKTKVIHVFDFISEPLGSKGTCTGFTRGIGGLPQEIEQIKEMTGGVIGYIGEWHSHPMNLKKLSCRDEETIYELKELNHLVPIPTCALIVTPDELLVYIQE